MNFESLLFKKLIKIYYNINIIKILIIINNFKFYDILFISIIIKIIVATISIIVSNS